MDLFPVTPNLRPCDRRRLAPFLGNAKKVRAWVREHPAADDLKRAVMMEAVRTESCGTRPDVLRDLLVALQRTERIEILKKIEKLKP